MIEEEVSAAVRVALAQLGLSEVYRISRPSVSDDGTWCARLTDRGHGHGDMFLCIPGQAPAWDHVDRFRSQIARHLGLRGADAQSSRSTGLVSGV